MPVVKKKRRRRKEGKKKHFKGTKKEGKTPL